MRAKTKLLSFQNEVGTKANTNLDDLRGWLGLLERLAGVVHDVDLHARALVTERRVEPRSRARRDVVARRGLKVHTVRFTETEKPGLNLRCRRPCRASYVRGGQSRKGVRKA